MLKQTILSAFLVFVTATVYADDCSRSCSPSCVREAQRTLDAARDYLASCGASGGPGGPGGGAQVELYNSDSCSSDFLGFVSPRTNCSSIPTNKRAWGIKVSGQCHDISDMDADVACEMFKAAGSRRAVALYNSDSCSGDLLAFIDRSSDCESMARRANKRVWGIRVNGQCHDISDTDFLAACNQYSGR